jgi:hypothetical protein
MSQNFNECIQPPQSTYTAQKALPRITVRLNGEIQSIPVPNPPEKLILRLPPLSLHTNLSEPDTSTNDSNEFDDSDVRAVVERVGSDLTEEEDGPSWMFEEDEVISKDPNYVFCPAVHRKQILHLFAKHFCQHPLFPEQSGTHTASEIRIFAVREMYLFCHQRGLREAWGYLWSQWYSAQKWILWARSTTPYVSRIRTTMGAENFWKQLKGDFLHHLARPRLDQLVWILCSKVIPAWIARAQALEDDFRAGRSKSLTTYQNYFKRAWKAHANASASGRAYQTNVSKWQCNCGRQKFDAYALCKHLVHAIPQPPPRFWRQVVRRRTVPFYQHPVLQSISNPSSGDTTVDEFVDVNAGSITDGDDHKWLGDMKVLTDGGWRKLNETNKAGSILGKRESEDDRDVSENERWKSNSPEMIDESDDEDEVRH